MNVKEACLTVLACALGKDDASYYDQKGFLRKSQIQEDLQVKNFSFIF